MKEIRSSNLTTGVVSIFFLLIFGYFRFFIPYHLINLEQNQLFLFSKDYILAFFDKPGAFANIAGTFITQFFIDPWLAASILTLLALGSFFLIRYILKVHRFKGILFQFLPIIFMVAVQSSFNYTINFQIGWILSLAFFAGYISIRQITLRVTYGIAVGILSYYAIGGYFIIAILLASIHELFYREEQKKLYFILAYLMLVILIPLLSWKFIYYINIKDAWLFPVSIGTLSHVNFFLYLHLLFLPLTLIVVYFFLRRTSVKAIEFNWNLKYGLISLVILALLGISVIKFAYDPKNEAFLEIDYHIQKSQWEKVLQLSEKYPGTNQVVMYYTNLALYKTGRFANELFNYKQSGTSGLWLEWKRNETAPFYGGEVFYQLSYTSEAFRWAFEAMEAKGPSPRLLKRLALTSIAHYKYNLANKYLTILDQSLYYNNWAKHYKNCIDDTTLIQQDNELLEKRYYVAKNDFISDISPNDIGFIKLLENHPDNRMAFEYLMASYLLNKNLKGFAANIYRLKELGYSQIPKHFEEALLLYMGITRQNYVPEGYAISSDTQLRFRDYAETFAQYRNSPELAAKWLFPQFGRTFWFYMQFSNSN